MLRHVYASAVLLSYLNYFSCTTPSEQFTQNLQDTAPRSKAVSPIRSSDTAGLYQAFQNYSQQNQGRIHGNPPQWSLLTLTGAESGMVPMSVYFDDSIGFDALFFRRTNGEFKFYCISSLPGKSITTPLLPEPDVAGGQ